mgnify:CR=1 FL=1
MCVKEKKEGGRGGGGGGGGEGKSDLEGQIEELVTVSGPILRK